MTAHRDLRLPAGGSYVLRHVRLPACFLDAVPPATPVDGEGNALVDLPVADGSFGRPQAAGTASGTGADVDIGGRVAFAALVDMHAHLDKGQVIPRAMPDGTLEGGVRGTLADRQRWTHADMRARMEFGVRCAYVHGVGAIRTHLDSHAEFAARSWEVFRELRADWKGRMELQAVGLVPLTAFRDGGWGEKLADTVAREGGILGAATDALGVYEGPGGGELVRLLERFFEIAGTRNLDADLHVDQSDDLSAFSLPSIAEVVLRTGFRGRVVADHCVNLALQPDDVLQRTIDLCAKAGIAVVTLPTPMMYLQDRRKGRTPRWRGVTAAHELIAAGVPTAIGGDNCRDAWFPFGDHDMVDTIQQSVRVFQLDDPVSRAVAMAGPVPSDIVAEPGVGRVREGASARLILFSARSLNEFMCRPQADRIVIDAGRRVEMPLPDYAELDALMGPAV